MARKIILLALMTALILTGCKETYPFKNSQPTTITEPAGVRPHYHWKQGHWRWSRKHQMHVWEDGKWVNARKHTKWVKGHWVTTSKGKKYLEGHWE